MTGDEDTLAEKFKAWKKFRARPYKRYANPNGNFKEINRKSGNRLNKNVPLTSKVSELISPEMKLKLNKIV